MFEGKSQPAIRFLTVMQVPGREQWAVCEVASQTPKGRISEADYLQLLSWKHLCKYPMHPIIYEQIDSQLICSIALKGQRAACLSDASRWRRLLSSFYKESTDLCEAVAMVGRRICQHLLPVTLDNVSRWETVQNYT